MVKINKKVEYALIVLKHLSTNVDETLVTARIICDKYSTPFDTTSRVMQLMNSVGVLDSSQGKKGGYKLNKDLGNISYLELVELIEGRKFSQDCKEAKCALIESCNITGPVKKLNDYLAHFFRGLSIKELLSDNKFPEALLMNIEGNNE